jgi:hypothetical protein
VKLKKKVRVVDPKIITRLVRGRKVRFLTGKSAESGIKVFRILPKR